MNIDLKARLTNKAWLVSTVSLVIVLLQQIGLGQLADYIPKNYADIINSVLVLAGTFGIAVDTSTPGISDSVPKNNEQGITFNVDGVAISNGQITVKNADSTSQIAINPDSINSSVQDASASAKIEVTNPDNIQAIGREVSHISASSPNEN